MPPIFLASPSARCATSSMNIPATACWCRRRATARHGSRANSRSFRRNAQSAFRLGFNRDALLLSSFASPSWEGRFPVSRTCASLHSHDFRGRAAVTNVPFKTALIVGAGSGLSASLARALAKEGIKVALAARTPDDPVAPVQDTGAKTFACDASRRAEVDKLFTDLDASFGTLDIAIYNASFRTRGAFIDLDPAEVEKAIAVTAYGAFLVAQQAARRMLANRRGAILLTGASAGVKGYAQSAPFPMGKFARRGRAQSMARELSPQGIHVAHVVIDGGIRSARRPAAADAPDSLLDPDAIAATYMHLIRQPRSAWAWEVELRPWVEKF